MPWFVGLCWTITMLATCLAGALLFFTFVGANGAPQEAAGAAIAVAICVIPYVFTRGCQAYSEMERLREMAAALNAIRDAKKD